MVALKRKKATKVFEPDGKYGFHTYVRYHATDVVAFDNKEIILKKGGWASATTKARMNQASVEFNLNFHVFQRYGDWFVTDNHGTYPFNEDELILTR